MPGKEGRPFKYGKPDGTIDTEKIGLLLDAYFEERDSDARKAAYNKLTIKEKEQTTEDKMTAKGVYTIAGMCVALDVDRNTLLLWEKGLTSDPVYDDDGKDVSRYNWELSSIIKKAKAKVVESLEELRNNNPIMSIFLLKNHAGYADKQEQDVTVNANIRFSMGDLGDLAK
jgi:hypothetical protein